jgi:DNA-directed RNA polymerase subunit RPC12/RpoP
MMNKEPDLPDNHPPQVIEVKTVLNVDEGPGVQCPRCGSNFMKRKPRGGFLEGKVYAIFGYYPWRCTKCLGSFFLKKRGKPRTRQELGAAAE